jgi:hypothetical protein
VQKIEVNRVRRHVAALAKRLKDGIRSQLDGVVLNGPKDDAQRYIGNVNLSFSYVEGESLIMGLKVTHRNTDLKTVLKRNKMTVLLPKPWLFGISI